MRIFAASIEITPEQPYTAADLKKAYPQYTWGESRLMN